MNKNTSTNSIKETLIDGLDFSNFDDATWNFIRNHVSAFGKVDVEIVWKDLTGTLDGTVQLQYSVNAANWSNIPTISPFVLSTANGSLMLSSEIIGGALNLLVTKNNITGGTLDATVVLKK